MTDEQPSMGSGAGGGATSAAARRRIVPEWKKMGAVLDVRQPTFFGFAVAVVLGAALGFLVVGAALLQPSQSDPKGNLDVSGPVSRAMAGWASFRALREHFPADYGALVKSVTADVGAGAAVEPAMRRAFGSLEPLRRREDAHFGMARVQTLRESLLAELALLTHLQAAHGGRACSNMAVKGLSSTLRLLGSAASQDKALWPLADSLVANFLNTAAEGMREKLTHAQPTQQQWQAFAVHLLSQGLSQEDLAVFAEPAKSSEKASTCDVFIKVIDVTSKPGVPATEPVIPFIAQSVAATL